MRYPTRRAIAVNHGAVTIAARTLRRTVSVASALILASISSTSTVIAQPAAPRSPPPAQAGASDLTAIQGNSGAPPPAPPAGSSAPPIGSAPGSAPAAAPAPASARAPVLATSADLDGLHLWLGPTGAVTQAPDGTDSCVGLELALTRVRERAPLGAAGLALGAGRYASSDAGRLWAHALVGTRRGTGWMAGASAGPLLELSPLARPRLGASAGLWLFVGVVPFVRIATVEGRGLFAEAGVSIALPVIRWAR
jgi:hypothetical protein